MISVNFNLRSPHVELTSVVLTCRWGKGKVARMATGVSVYVASWDLNKQRCYTSQERFSRVVNAVANDANTFLDELKERLEDHFSRNHFSDFTDTDTMKRAITYCVAAISLEKKRKQEAMGMTPLQFFAKRIEENIVDSRTGRIIAERTKAHQRSVLKRFEAFLNESALPDDWSVFRSHRFDSQFTSWCYKKNYKQNTVYASYGVLKPWLNAARTEGFDCGDNYRKLKGKGVDVDAIYLTEEEITSIYKLDIPSLIRSGEVDAKSTMEETRDLFLIGCWTGLRRSDLSRLDEAVFDMKNNLITITAAKTAKKVIIPMHPYVVQLYRKYKGVFPKLTTRSHSNEHIKEIGRLSGIVDTVSITENRGGVVKDVKYRKYELIGMHTARRSFATNMYKRGFPSISIMRITGHTTESNFLKYIKVSLEENANQVASKFRTFFGDV